jgi:hypothetical protein
MQNLSFPSTKFGLSSPGFPHIYQTPFLIATTIKLFSIPFLFSLALERQLYYIWGIHMGHWHKVLRLAQRLNAAADTTPAAVHHKLELVRYRGMMQGNLSHRGDVFSI